MANLGAPVLTRLGRKVLAQAQTGLPLHFTRVTVGDGEMPGGIEIEDMTELVGPIRNLPINRNEIIGDGTTKMDCILSNQDLTVGFDFRELGIFAKDNDTGLDILYAYTNAGDLPDYIPAGNGPHAVNLVLGLVTVVKQAANIVVEISQGYGFVTEEQMETFVLDLFRPYKAPTGFWVLDDTEPEKLRPATKRQVLTALFAETATNESVLIGYDPVTDDIFGFPFSRIVTTNDRVRGGTPGMEIADYEGSISGGSPDMALEDYPDGSISGGDPFTG